MEFGGAKKRGRFEGGVNGHGGFKKSKQERESITTGIGSKSKPCTKFFSPSGCPFGEGCHFLHYVPGGIKAVAQILGSNPAVLPAARNPMGPPSFPDGSSPPAVKTRLCNRFATAEGCKYGDKCNFAHGQHELGRPTFLPPPRDDPHLHAAVGGGGGPIPPPAMGGRFGGAPPPAGFGASATAKISIDAGMAGAVIGKGGVNSKQIIRATGAKMSVREHETNAGLRNIELEGTFDQIKQASQMVHELVANISATAAAAGGGPPGGKGQGGMSYGPGSSNFKTKLCENFTKGVCTFGERCHFAHGAEELRKALGA